MDGWKVLRKNSGAAMVLVILTVTILILVGTILFEAVYLNYRISKIDSNIEYSYYAVTSAVEKSFFKVDNYALPALSQKKTSLGSIPAGMAAKYIKFQILGGTVDAFGSIQTVNTENIVEVDVKDDGNSNNKMFVKITISEYTEQIIGTTYEYFVKVKAESRGQVKYYSRKFVIS